MQTLLKAGVSQKYLELTFNSKDDLDEKEGVKEGVYIWIQMSMSMPMPVSKFQNGPLKKSCYATCWRLGGVPFCLTMSFGL